MSSTSAVATSIQAMSGALIAVPAAPTDRRLPSPSAGRLSCSWFSGPPLAAGRHRRERQEACAVGGRSPGGTSRVFADSWETEPERGAPSRKRQDCRNEPGRPRYCGSCLASAGEVGKLHGCAAPGRRRREGRSCRLTPGIGGPMASRAKRIVARQKLPPRLVTKRIWEERFEDIAVFERYLARQGYVILKFFLHVSKKAQKERFLERLDRPEKNWKFSLADAQERGHWGEDMRAYEDMIRHTAAPHAPWYVVPADRKWFTRLVVAAAVHDALDRLDLAYPRLDAAKRKQHAAPPP